jgi:hypothetical protein
MLDAQVTFTASVLAIALFSGLSIVKSTLDAQN